MSEDNIFLSSAALPVANAEPLLIASTIHIDDEKSGESSIEPPAYSPLTPRLLNVPGESSIEAPAYSPLTPRLLNVPGERSIEPPAYSPLTPRPPNEVQPVERSIEPPACSPLTPRPPNVQMLMSPKPHCSTKENIPNIQFLSSPLQPMSPETTELFNILADSLDNEESNINSNENAALDSPIPSDITNIMNSDDSVQDPDFVCHNENGISSDKSSEDSVSLLATIEEGPQTAIELRDETNTSNHNSSSLILQEEDIETEASIQGRPKRGRKRLYGGDLREDRKKKKYNNLSYVNTKKQVVESKVFIDYSCNCPKQCQEKVSSEQKLEEFNKFYSFGSYVAQNMYLIACIKEKPKKRAYVTTARHNLKRNNKTYTREYYLKNILVCKQMFLNTLQTSSKRINTALCKMRNNCLKDMRGLQAGQNAASTDSELFLENIIRKLPTYISHYRRAKSNDAKFLTSDMTLPKIYNLYSEEAKSAGQRVLSYSKVRHVFVTKFNLRTKPLKKDTCNKCDFYESKKNQASEEEKRKIEEDHKKHIDKAKFLQQELKKDMKLAKDDPTIETITFDLQKTLPLPRIPTNIVFYKRQLWVYNLGIHTGSNDQVHCNVWVEGEAGRGSQEVGSCLIKHITERLKDGVEILFLWSDSCGGQNRNIKLTLMLKALLNDHPTLKEIHHRFLESGHSFLPNDTDFGRIECSLNP
ncbi:unnamed protein product [Spodoptera littoralis]|uniref:Uncharacterized protein n=1 Tax=Spodoptera littoralis TaxID=7109 RepID=A0A9P0MYG3_SPOLI|nr:unnamed protein product [Spodoptera littoralis]CAH1634669.1 unnamed protein product [Spodoptera littoralis]